MVPSVSKGVIAANGVVAAGGTEQDLIPARNAGPTALGLRLGNLLRRCLHRWNIEAFLDALRGSLDDVLGIDDLDNLNNLDNLDDLDDLLANDGDGLARLTGHRYQVWARKRLRLTQGLDDL